MSLMMHLYSLLRPDSNFSFPGEVMDSSTLKDSLVQTRKRHCTQDNYKNNELHKPLYTTDGVYCTDWDDTDRYLHILLAIYNPFDSDLEIYDIYARKYIDHIEDAKLIMTENRTQIAVSCDNSILSDGKVYKVEPNGSFSVDLVLRVRMTNQGIMHDVISVFGIFAKVRWLSENEVKHEVLPSDAIYIFRDPPSSYMEKSNFAFFTKAKSSHISRLSARRILSALLKKHLRWNELQKQTMGAEVDMK